MSQPQKKRRAINWSPNEIAALLDGVAANKDILLGRFDGNAVSSFTKQAAWRRVTAMVNSVSQCVRQWSDVKKKWTDHKSITKKKVGGDNCNRNKTGGGLPKQKSTREYVIEEKTLKIIRPLATYEIEDGSDSSMEIISESIGLNDSAMPAVKPVANRPAYAFEPMMSDQVVVADDNSRTVTEGIIEIKPESLFTTSDSRDTSMTADETSFVSETIELQCKLVANQPAHTFEPVMSDDDKSEAITEGMIEIKPESLLTTSDRRKTLKTVDEPSFVSETIELQYKPVANRPAHTYEPMMSDRVVVADDDSKAITEGMIEIKPESLFTTSDRRKTSKTADETSFASETIELQYKQLQAIERQTAAIERQAAASERQAAASERQAAASERQAAASERQAAAIETISYNLSTTGNHLNFEYKNK